MHYAPWTFCILTFGCKVNQYESQSVREAWQRMDGAETDTPAEADVILLNTCAVTANAVTDARQAVRRLQREAPGVPVVIAGCAAEVARKQLAALPGVLRVVEQDHKSRLLDAPPLVLFAEEAAGSATPFPSSPAEAAARAATRDRTFPPFHIDGFRRARPVLKVQDGCSHGCAYCIVPLTRGPARSRPPKECLAEMRRLLDDERLEVLDWRGKRVNTPGFVEALATADIAVTGNSLTITDELLEKLPNLKLIAKLGTGLDMIDIPSVLRRGILLCNTPGANSVAVAEHTFALLLGYLRNVPQCDNAVRTGQWEKARTMGGEICGKTVGIIGLGNIGSRVASRMAGFEARLLGTDPCWPEALAAKYGIERRELNELLAESDIVCVHCPLDETTAGFIGKAELALMKPSALLVNMARGGIVDEDALYEALRGKVISGAIIDAYS